MKEINLGELATRLDTHQPPYLKLEHMPAYVHPWLLLAFSIVICLYPLEKEGPSPALRALLCVAYSLPAYTAVGIFCGIPQAAYYVGLPLALLSTCFQLLGVIAAVGLASASLVSLLTFVPGWSGTVLTGAVTISGVVCCFAFDRCREHWQMVVAPIVGGFFAKQALEGVFPPAVGYAIWAAAALLSALLHWNKHRHQASLAMSWRDALLDIEEPENRANIAKALGEAVSAPTAPSTPEAVLAAARADPETADRVAYGGGLY